MTQTKKYNLNNRPHTLKHALVLYRDQDLPQPCVGRLIDDPPVTNQPKQASLVDAEFDIRPGVTVQESGLPDGATLGQESRATAEVLRSKSGPVAMPVPGRLSRTAYKVLHCRAG